eukprot:CAMPEP_0202458932 /NCGR_PEP_ID=MMETSP1360-20130828/28685_1 /ASSEMBLY_ACC=CAM_ASM_000848 /TAXON_ID=515479 /ORGANISM="Licmophora paradoxa, Strain CCMP2313" /LENGTH=421 /DNA_ID=CAMNT_0049079693 /DNA_START=44 /DNA_END=1309 /DNA_ORIENTATION=-
MAPPEVWDTDMLMGKTGPAQGKGGAEAATKDRTLWGIPGYLTAEEAETFEKFKAEIEKRGEEFRDTIYSFTEEEGECWALCRWLRARKFVYEDVIKMIEEATVCRADAKKDGFYPDPSGALGCDMALYFAQFPQLYSGVAKNGAPLFISKPGVLNTDAVECITTLDGILKLHWYIMIHDFGDRLRAQKKLKDDFKSFECVCVLDLAKLSTSQLSSRTLSIIKEQSAIDSLCFPETMSKMVIVNAPMFFSATWGIIKGWLDPRTANKVSVLSSRTSWEKKLKELVDVDQLPSDYGGTGPNTIETLDASSPGDMKRLKTEVLYLRGSGSVKADIADGESVEIAVWTRSNAGATFSVTDQNKVKPDWVSGVVVKHVGNPDTSEKPTETKLTKERIRGPAKLKIKADSLGGRFTSYNFLVSLSIY